MANLIQQQQIQGLENTLTGFVGYSTLNATGNLVQNNLATTGTILSGIDVILDGRLDSTGYQLAADISTFSGRLETTGTTLVTSIGVVETNLLYTGTKVIAMSGNLQDAIRNTGLAVLTDTSTRSGNLQTNITTNTSQIAIVSGIAVGATGTSDFNRNLITGSNSRSSTNEVNITLVSGLTVNNAAVTNVLSGNVSGIENTLTGKYDASGNAISGALNFRIIATGAALSGLASETRLYQTGTISDRMGIDNTDPGRAATLGYTNYSASLYGETMINAGATSITATRVLQWGGDMGPYETGELFLARSAGKRAYVPVDRTWFVKMYGTMKDVSPDSTRGSSVYNLEGYETGFIIDCEAHDGTTEIRVSMGGTAEEDKGGTIGFIASGVTLLPFATGSVAGEGVMGISGRNPSASTVRYRVTAIVTESNNTPLV